MRINKVSVAIVGAGISGLSCARYLLKNNIRATIFDKGKHYGGRMATRFSGEYQFDHGAQYFTVKGERFREVVDYWLQAGIVAEWWGRIAVVDNGTITDTRQQRSRHVGVPAMRSICEHLAESCDVRSRIKVQSARRDKGKWNLLDGQGRSLGSFDILILALPPKQATNILRPSETPILTMTDAVDMKGCWAVMAAFDHRLGVPFDGAFIHNSSLSWIARDSSKPGRPSATDSWVLHGSPDWSQEHLEDNVENVKNKLVDELFRVVRYEKSRPCFAQAHRWRFAIPNEPLTEGFLYDRSQQLGLCGDWCHGARVEGAFLSGVHLAEQIVECVR